MPFGIRSRRHTIRCGTMLMVALVAMFVCSIMGAALMSHAVAMQRESKRSHWLEQSHWLAVSAMTLARIQLRRLPDYQGETWTVTGNRSSAVQPVGIVTIRVDRTERIIRIEARYPGDSTTDTALTTRTLPLPPGISGVSP